MSDINKEYIHKESSITMPSNDLHGVDDYQIHEAALLFPEMD
jgi:hypothetical protein